MSHLTWVDWLACLLGVQIIAPAALCVLESISGHLRPVFDVIRKTSDEYGLSTADRAKLYAVTTLRMYAFTFLYWPLCLTMRTLHLLRDLFLEVKKLSTQKGNDR